MRAGMIFVVVGAAALVGTENVCAQPTANDDTIVITGRLNGQFGRHRLFSH